MTPESMDHDLTRQDPADAPRCEMERLADRFMDAPKPTWIQRNAWREYDGSCYFNLEGWVHDPDQLDDLINFLSRVRG